MERCILRGKKKLPLKGKALMLSLREEARIKSGGTDASHSPGNLTKDISSSIPGSTAIPSLNGKKKLPE